MKKVVISAIESSKYVVFVSGPWFDDATLGIRTFVAEGFARGQLDLVVTQAVLGPGLVHDLVDLLPLAELAEVAVRHRGCGRGGGVQGRLHAAQPFAALPV